MRRGRVLATLLISMAIRCLIVDDNRPFLVAARVLLERQGLIVVGVASTSTEAMLEVETSRPDVVLVDISLGAESGIDLARRLIGDDPGGGPMLILISTRAEQDVQDLMTGCRAAAFLPKSELSAEAIRRIVDGRSQ